MFVDRISHSGKYESRSREAFLAIAVGTPVARCPPHRPGREVCPDFCVNGQVLFLGMG